MRPMTCANVRPHLLDYAWQLLTSPEAAEVEAHLSVCPACRALLEDEQAVAASLAAVPKAAPQRDLWDSVRIRVNARQTTAGLASAVPAGMAAQSRTRHRARTWMAAASFAAVATLAMLAPPREYNPRRIAVEPPGASTVAATLDLTRAAASQSDDPLDAFADATWAALGDPEKG